MNFRNPADCLNLLHNLHPVNVAQTHATLSEMVLSLLDSMPAPNQHLEVLEAARDLLHFVQAEMGQSYAAYPIAPGDPLNQNLIRVVELWKQLARSYDMIALRDAGQGTLEDQRALLAQRRIQCAGMVLVEHFRAHRAVPAGCWTALHGCYADAMQAEVNRIRVVDPLNEVWKAQSPLEAYITVLLIAQTNPNGRSERELRWILRWAPRFAPYCELSSDAEHPAPGTIYGVNLACDHGLILLSHFSSTSSILHIDSSTLRRQLRAVMAQLKQGVQPASLGLGEDCTAEDSARLLMSLYRPWSLSTTGRRFQRHRSQGTVALTGAWPAICFGIEGQAFEPPRSKLPQPSLHDDMYLLTFGERVPQARPPASATDGLERRRMALDCEHWTVLDQSIGGFRLQLSGSAERLLHRQLVGLIPHDGEKLLLGQISWQMYRSDGQLEAGVSLLPGVPRVLPVRQVVSSGRPEAFQQAFLLPENPAMKAAASLVLPGAWFRPGRLIEVLENGVTRVVSLHNLILRGANFDQVGFEPVPAIAQ